MVKWGAGAVAAFLLLIPGVAGPVQDAITDRDVLKLEELSRAEAPEIAKLAAGAALSLRHNDETALAILEPLARLRTDIGAGACLALADIYLRQGRYGDLRTALECAGPLNPEASQVRDYAKVLAGEKPMRLAAPVRGQIGTRRDGAGLPRVHVQINGEDKNAVIDTDASFCVLAESDAERLGLRVLDTPVTIITSTRRDQPMRLGVADELRFGDAVLTDVVFAVLPDAALRFGDAYRMNAVIGLPVLVALGRIEMAEEQGSEVLYYGRRSDLTSGTEPNMALSGLDPFALLQDERTGAVLRLAIDSAAQKTTLNGTARREFPMLTEGSSRSWTEWQGAGGRQSDDDVRIVPELRLLMGSHPVGLKKVKMLSVDEHDRHGAIGQDFLKQGHRWIIDFDAMHFAVID